MSAASIVALGYVGWIVHSQLRELRHLASVSAGAAPPVSTTSPSNAAAAAGAVRDDGDLRLRAPVLLAGLSMYVYSKRASAVLLVLPCCLPIRRAPGTRQ